MWVQSLVQGDPLEEGTAPHSKWVSILAWRIPWTEEPGRLQSMGSQSQTRLKWLSSYSSSLPGVCPLDRAALPAPPVVTSQSVPVRCPWGQSHPWLSTAGLDWSLHKGRVTSRPGHGGFLWYCRGSHLSTSPMTLNFTNCYKSNE